MNIAVVHNLGTGGARRALHGHLAGLRARGHRLHLFAPRVSERYESLAPLCAEVTLYGNDAPGGQGVSSLGGDGGRGRQLARRLLGEALYEQVRDGVWTGKQREAARQMEQLYASIAEAVLNSAPDVVYVHQCQQLLVPRTLLALLAGRVPVIFYLNDTLRRAQEWPVVTDAAYDTLRSGLLRQRDLGRVVSPAMRRLRDEERARYELGLRTLVQAPRARLLVNSYFSRDNALRTAGVDAHVCYFGMDTNFWTPPEPNAHRRLEVLSVGALRPEKRHDRVIEAVATIPAARRPPLRLVGYPLQAGDLYVARLQALADRQSVRLIVDSDVSDETLRAAYRQAGVTVFAPYLEPFGLAPLEALACAAPVVAVAEGGLRETIRDDVGILTEGSPNALGQAISRVLQNPIHAAEQGTAGRLWATTWTWDKSVDTVEGHLNAVARGGAT